MQVHTSRTVLQVFDTLVKELCVLEKTALTMGEGVHEVILRITDGSRVFHPIPAVFFTHTPFVSCFCIASCRRSSPLSIHTHSCDYCFFITKKTKEEDQVVSSKRSHTCGSQHELYWTNNPCQGMNERINTQFIVSSIPEHVGVNTIILASNGDYQSHSGEDTFHAPYRKMWTMKRCDCRIP